MKLLGLLFAVYAVAAPTSPLVVHEKRSVSRLDINEGSRRVARNAVIPVRIALSQSNLDDGYVLLMELSDPNSERYGKHWSIEDIHAKFAPSEETIEAVVSWLEAAGIPRDQISESSSKGWVGADMPVSHAERLFGTEYYEHHDSAGNVDVGCDSYHVPSHLSHHIDFIEPGIGLSHYKRTVRKRNPIQSESRKRAADGYGGDLATCGKAITPACLKALYSIPDATLNQPENALGIFEQGDIYDQTDLDLYFENFAPYVPTGTHPTLVSINGAKAPVGVNNSAVTGESVIDLDLAYALIYPQTIILYQQQITPKQEKAWEKQVPGGSSNKAYYATARAITEDLQKAVDGSFCTATDKAQGTDCGTVELTRVLSISYGIQELFLPEAATKRACNEYMKLGLKGHTIVVSSGDYGPAGHVQFATHGIQNACAKPGHLDNAGFNGTVFNPSFPATCPYVTTVGATQLHAHQTVAGPESAMHDPQTQFGLVYSFSSSGGFSNYFPEPGYQSSAVSSYLDNHDPGYPTYVYKGKDSVGAGGGIHATGGRAFPDIAANGQNLAVFIGGKPYPGGQEGTSLSAPIVASIITRINQERTVAGKGPVGFINPVLYKNAGIFNDITLGSAPGCYTPGYSCVPGWDPVTGLGTPNYPDLLNAFMALP